MEGKDERTNVAIWVPVFSEVSLSLLKDCSQSSRVVNGSARTVRTLKPVSSTVGVRTCCAQTLP